MTTRHAHDSGYVKGFEDGMNGKAAIQAAWEDYKKDLPEPSNTIDVLADTLKYLYNKLYILRHTKKAVSKQCMVDCIKAFDKAGETLDYLYEVKNK